MEEDITEKRISDFRRKFKARIRGVQQEEQRLVDEGSPIQDNAWLMYEGNIRAYDLAFSDILKELGYESLRDWMEQRKKAGLTTHVLDVMGGNGTFLRDLSKFGKRGREVSPHFDKSLVVTLANERAQWNKWVEEDQRRGIEILAGDVTSGSTWRGVSKWLKKEGIPAFDLVVCRAVEGLDYITTALYGALLERFYRSTINQDGLILSQLSTEVNHQLSAWKRTFDEVPGIKFITQPERNRFISMGSDYPAVGLHKSAEAPSSLSSVIKNIK